MVILEGLAVLAVMRKLPVAAAAELGPLVGQAVAAATMAATDRLDQAGQEDLVELAAGLVATRAATAGLVAIPLPLARLARCQAVAVLVVGLVT